jgi:preprotein translocase subunit SecF
MDKKTIGIIATVASVLLCGCPGIFICLFGALTAAGQGTFNDASLSPAVGFVLLCLSLIFIAIPIVVGVVTLRKKPQPPVDNEPIPPAA